MNLKIKLVLAILLCTVLTSKAQDSNRLIKGYIFDHVERNNPLDGANIYSQGLLLNTQSNEKGYFQLAVPDSIPYLVISFLGYQNDTLYLKSPKELYRVYMKASKELKSVTITHRKKATEISTLGILKTERIGQKELLKAACCNLSESFETTPSVDVSFTDAISGYKQIQMLGLSGPNTLFTRENIPDVRGLAAITGLTFTPGTWIDNMQLSKGTGSVVNGPEGLAGQINIEWRKPFEEADKWNFNLYQNSQGRTEGNVVHKFKVNKNVSSNLFLHGRNQWMRLDQNKDAYMDQPLGNQFIAANRWFAFLPHKFELQWGVKASYADNVGGMHDFKKGQAIEMGKTWGYESDINRIEAWAKIGKIFENKSWKSMGLQLSTWAHQQNAMYGFRNYKGKDNGLYANYIYQSIIDNTNHIIKTGASFNLDHISENVESVGYTRKEINTGVFAEYSYQYLEKFNLVAGIRADYNNLFGFYATPRLHLRYAPWYNAALRASVGRAQRTANFLSENMAYLASNRAWIWNQNNMDYSLKPEVAWNYGLNFTQKFKLNYKEGTFSFDLYNTQYQNQIVVDIENPDQVKFYNLNGQSFAKSFQAQLDYEPIRKLDVRLAYRWYDVQTQYQSGLKEKPLVARNRAFINIGYEFAKSWNIDYTLHWTGSKRVPLSYHQKDHLLASYQSPDYIIMNAQISKHWTKAFEVYLGVENIANIMQHQMILNSDNPFGKGFDASLIWGSAMGRNIYAGLRYNIK